jgi:ADP-ribose pyrophosphatase
MTSHPSGETVFRCAKFSVRRVGVTTHDGEQRLREVVVHPGAVVILAVMDDGRIVMIRNQRFAVGKELIELPAGTLEEGEEPILCAGRELIEETGYQAATLEPLTSFYSSPGFYTEKLHVFVARGLTHVGQQLEDTEHIRVEPMTLADVLGKIQCHEIEDAKTMAAILYYSRFFGGTS